MEKSLHFVVNVSIGDIDLGDLGESSFEDVIEKIRQTVKAISKSKDLREEYAKGFCEELGNHADLYANIYRAIDKGMRNVIIKGMNGLNYKKMLEDRMPVTFDNVGIEDGKEVERMWLADFVDGKWVEDYVEVRRETYDIEKDNDGAVFALILNGRMLVKAPNVKYYRIPEDVYRIADYAFKECTELEELDVPYTINDYEIAKSFDHSCVHPKLHLWDWAYDCTRSEELEKEIAEGWTDEQGFVYSQDCKRLLKAALEWKEYWIPEGVKKIVRLAFIGCKYEDLHIPYTCKVNDWPM